MRLFVPLSLLALGAEAFSPAVRPFVGTRPSPTARSFGVDPSHFHDAQHQLSSLGDMLSSLTIADLEASVPDVGDVVAEVAKSDNGWFGFLTGPIENLLMGIHSVIASTGTANSWGVSIIALTVLIKVVTFPLTKTQLEGTNKMQAMQPAIKEIQAKYQSNPEVMNEKIAAFYKDNEINPLAGCLPSLVQIPVFIGLYRSVLSLAAENKLNEPFLWLPSLQGPTYGADPASGSDWILKGW
jgi:YidC/Oxa1 family membrane protein insertase